MGALGAFKTLCCHGSPFWGPSFGNFLGGKRVGQFWEASDLLGEHSYSARWGQVVQFLLCEETGPALGVGWVRCS